MLPGRCPIEGQLECKIFVHEATIWISRPEYVVSGPGSSLKKTPPSRLKSTLPLQKSPFLRFLVNLRKTGSIYKEQKTRKPPFSLPFPPFFQSRHPRNDLSLLGTREGPKDLQIDHIFSTHLKIPPHLKTHRTMKTRGRGCSGKSLSPDHSPLSSASTARIGCAF